MAKATITILCPSGHRRKAQMTPNNNLLQVLEDMCNQEDLDSSEWGLIHQRKKCDLTTPWRLLNIPTNALLEMYKLEQPRPITDVTIQLQLPDSSRYTGSFKPSTTLKEMLNWYRAQPESMIAALDISVNNADQLSPVCAYMSEEVIGDYALANTTLRELGLTSGTAVIRYNHRAMTDEELKKIKERIDTKINRRQQQTAKPTSTPPPPPPATTYNLPTPVIDTPIPSVRSDEYSIFRDLPVTRPARTTNQPEPQTLAQALGINISFDHQPLFQARPQTDLSNFKFPEATKGQDLNQSSDSSQRTRSSNSCDRHTIAYDLTTIPSTSATRTEELPDSFFELTPDDLRSVLTSLRQQGSEENQLETRQMRERAQFTRNNAYKHIAIRLVLNSNLILQGLFYPTEPLSNLLEFARTNLLCQQSDFYLYTSPPRLVLSNLNKSLSAYDLAPASYVYLGHRTVSPLVIQLAPNVPIETIDKASEIVAQYVFNRSNSTNDEENSTAESSASNRPAKRNTSANNVDDKQLRDKLRKFLPGQK